MPIHEVHEVVVDGKSGDGKSTFRIPAHMELVKKVGSGAYGYVASFKNNDTGEKLAVKKITDAFRDLIDGKRILREVKLLRQFNHENIMRIIDMYPPAGPEFNDIYIVCDLMETDLHRVIYSKQPLTEEHHQYFVHQLLHGLVYLHSISVVHRDIKPSNLLVNKNCDLKICDFGLARVISDDESDRLGRTDYVVTRWYRAPEVVLLASEYNAAIDVWATGCILCELITRQPVFAGRDYLDQIKKIVEVLGTPTQDDLKWLPAKSSARDFLQKCAPAPKACWTKLLPGASEAAVEVIEEMLRFDPTVRVTCKDALRMQYFAGLFDEEDLKIDTRRSTPVDWSFDNFEPTKPLLQNYIYAQCASFHPDIVERDRDLLKARGLEHLLEKPKQRVSVTGSSVAGVSGGA